MEMLTAALAVLCALLTLVLLIRGCRGRILRKCGGADTAQRECEGR